MNEFLTIEQAYSYGITLTKARNLTDEESRHYVRPDEMFIGCGESIKLQHVRWIDLPKRKADGEFPGCSNRAWIVTQEEWDAFAALEESRAAEEESKKQDQIAVLEERKARAEAQKDLPTAEEAARRAREWAIVQNEGGEGYVLHIYSREEYADICRRLAELKGER